MIDILLITLLICLLAIFYYYYYSSTDVQCSTVASSILRIWTGNCGLSCRHSGYSRFSGMSGLNQPASITPANLPRGTGNVTGNIASNITGDTAGSTCICDPCPCGYIENIITSCRPATDIYARNVEMIAVYVAAIARLITETYSNVTDALDCNTTCQRQAQFISNRATFESTDNFIFDRDKTEAKKNKTHFPMISEHLRKKGGPSNTNLKNKDDENLNEREHLTQNAMTAIRMGMASSRPETEAEKQSVPQPTPQSTDSKKTDNPKDTKASCSAKSNSQDKKPEGKDTTTACVTSSKSSCTRCSDEGKVCMPQCPHHKRK